MTSTFLTLNMKSCVFLSQVFEDLHDYMKSLEKILTLKPQVVYPAHGAVVPDGSKHIEMYIKHRNAREVQILEFLKKHAEEYISVTDIVKTIYHVSLFIC